MNKNYDIDLILSNEQFKRNRENMLKQDKKKRYKLKRWVKNTLWLILGALIGITIYQYFTVETTHQTPVGEYTCNGGIVKICTGDKIVADYLG